MKNFLILFLFLSVIFSQEKNQEKNQHGPFVVYNEEGKIIEKGNYKDGLKHGEFYQYSERHINTLIYNNGSLIKSSTLYSSGYRMEINHKDDKLHGPFLWYDIQGNIYSKNNYIDGKLHGDSFFYYKDVNGIKSSIEFEGKYKNGKKVGVHTYYFRNGNIKEQTSYSNE